MPQNAADAQRRLTANDAVAQRIESQSGDDKGSVTRDNLGGFLDDLNKAADNARGSWDSFKKDNPNADPIALSSAADASILQANLPVLDAAGSSAAQVDGKINIDDAKAIAGAGNSLPTPLVAAASPFSNAGEFHKLDQAGDSDPSTPADGIVANGNFDYYLGHGTAKSTDDTNTDLKTRAIEQAVKDAGGDASKVNGDYFKDPSKSTASGADKAAAMIQMSETIARYNNGESAYITVPTQSFREAEAEIGGLDLSYSIGLAVEDDGRIDSVAWDSPAFRAGLIAGTRIRLVSGQPYSREAMSAAVSATPHARLTLDVGTAAKPQVLFLDYSGGLRYPRLEAIPGKRDRLAPLLAPR